jgi:tetratricopeptide (TPR) repeat protein
VCQEIRSEREEDRLKKDIGLHFVMSNVPDLDDEDKVLRRRLGAFHKELGFDKLAAVIHRYESVMLFNQAIFVLDRPKSRLAREYRRLVRAVITDNTADRDGVLRYLHRYALRYLPEVARDLAQEVDHRLGVPPKEEQPPFDDIDSSIEGLFGSDRLDRIAGKFLDDADVLLRIAECRTLEGDYAMAVAVLNRALTVKPDLAQALFERAMCQDRLGNRSAAAADLLSYLQLPGLESDDLLRAFRLLSAITPEKALEAVDLPAFHVLLSSKQDKVAVAETLAERDEGLPRAIQLLQEFRNGKWFPAGALLFQALMRARRWREALELLRSKFSATRAPYDHLLDLAMIRWGETGELPEDLCRQLLDLDDEEMGGRFDDNPVAKCLLLWRTGQAEKACRILDDVIDSFPEHPRREFSYWRFRNVQPDQYMEDCRQFRRMIQGEPIRPPFLGDPADAK